MSNIFTPDEVTIVRKIGDEYAFEQISTRKKLAGSGLSAAKARENIIERLRKDPSVVLVLEEKEKTITNKTSPAETVITLREIRLGDAVLKNVDASVVNSQQAPLLLGQSAMERLGSITIDNQSNKLIIKH